MLWKKFTEGVRNACLVGALSCGTFTLLGCDNKTENKVDDRLILFYRYQTYIAPSLGETRNYVLENGARVKVSRERIKLEGIIFDSFSDLLRISFNDSLEFHSYWNTEWNTEFRDRHNFNSLVKEFTKLGYVLLRDGNRWEVFSRDDMGGNLDEWQRRYEDLVVELGKIKYSFEKQWMNKYDQVIIQRKGSK